MWNGYSCPLPLTLMLILDVESYVILFNVRVSPAFEFLPNGRTSTGARQATVPINDWTWWEEKIRPSTGVGMVSAKTDTYLPGPNSLSRAP
jgi:hypothetical protein